MSMSRRDSDSKRRHSRFDREPSPRRYRRGGKHERDRDRATNGGDYIMNRDQRNHRHLLHDALPLKPPSAHHSNQPSGAVHTDTDNKPNDHNEAPKHAPHPTRVPRSLSYFQHDERGSAGQVDRSSGQRKSGERGWWKDSRNQHNERAEAKESNFAFVQERGWWEDSRNQNNERAETSPGREQQDEKSQARPDDRTSERRDCFPERKGDPPLTMRKRPAFREKKIPVDSGDANPAVTVAVKSSQINYPPERNERREERSSNPLHLDRPKKQVADVRAPYKGEARRDGFPLRGRNGGNGGNSNYRGRDKFNGRQDYLPNKTRPEKWKHDLYQEVNKDPIPKNEDDKIARLEALLAS